MLPGMAEQQKAPPRLLAQVDRWVRFSAAAVLPLCLVMALGLARGVGLLMRPGWSAAGQAALPLLAACRT